MKKNLNFYKYGEQVQSLSKLLLIVHTKLKVIHQVNVYCNVILPHFAQWHAVDNVTHTCQYNINMRIKMRKLLGIDKYLTAYKKFRHRAVLVP
ncbi:hypothetical protein B1A85_17995 [Chroococcidiopsis sp. TS-821]|nr:hypothetical protein B1A85_17995 [Chroococcidiopsis sp. TS-821]